MKKKTKIFITICTACIVNFNISNAQRGATINAEWVISSITLEDNSALDKLQSVPVFQDANINCLLNSTWNFLRGGKGSYQIQPVSGCAKGVRQINWKYFNLDGSDFFQFYRTSAVDGVRADKYSFYTCEVHALDEQSFTLRYPILFEDKKNAIIFHFTRK